MSDWRSTGRTFYVHVAAEGFQGEGIESGEGGTHTNAYTCLASANRACNAWLFFSPEEILPGGAGAVWRQGCKSARRVRCILPSQLHSC